MSANLKKDYKFENFLRSSMSSDDYERVKFYDLCVVESTKEKFVPKNVIFGFDGIYFTEEPPKTLIKEIHFNDFISVSLKADFPKAIMGPARDECQHLLITFRPKKTFVKSAIVDTKNMNDSVLEREKAYTTEETVDIETVAVSEKGVCCGKKVAVPQVENVPTEKNNLEEKSTLINRAAKLKESEEAYKARVKVASSVKNCETVEELHLYIINGQAPAMLLLKSAWKNFLLRATQLLDKNYLAQYESKHQLKLAEEKLNFLFLQLKSELLNCNGNFEKVFFLTSELDTATRKNFALKRLFWKNEDLFAFYIEFLSKHLRCSSLESDQIGFTGNRPINLRLLRADELDVCLLILQIILLMLQESENMASRSNCLRQKSGAVSQLFVRILLDAPSIPAQFLTSQSSRHVMTHYERELYDSDAELRNICSQIMNCTVSILCSLIQGSKGNVQEVQNPLFSETKIAEFLEENGDEGLDYVGRLILSAINLISYKMDSILTPTQAVNLYEQFFLISIIVRFSRSAKIYVKNNFIEEFKYFVQVPIVINRLSLDYPITDSIIKKIDEVTLLITGKKYFL